MNNTTLICSQRSPLLFLHKPSQSKWKPICSTIVSQTNMQKPNNKTWKLKGNAKGFTSTQTNIKNIANNNINMVNNNNNNNTSSNIEDDDTITEKVFYKIIRRILVCVGVPLGVGLLQLHLLGLVQEQNLWDVPKWVTFTTTFLCFGASALGVPYGSLSTSLDPQKEGSFFGFEEARHNWTEMWKAEDGQSNNDNFFL